MNSLRIHILQHFSASTNPKKHDSNIILSFLPLILYVHFQPNPHHRGSRGMPAPHSCHSERCINFKKWFVAHYKNATVYLTLRHVNALFN